MRSPIMWFGGKGPLTGWLLDYLPEHRVYVEVFGGGASLLFAKRPSPIEVYNDIDDGLVGFFRVLRDPEDAQELCRRLALTPYSRGEYDTCRHTWRDQAEAVERARQWYVVARQSFSGRFDAGWAFQVTESCRGRGLAVSNWQSAIDRLPLAHDRLLRVQVEKRDWRAVLDTYDTEETLFYLDPPYLSETRRAGGYANELTDDDHRDLVARLLALRGKAMLSGYDGEAYRPLEEAGWGKQVRDVACWAVGRTKSSHLQGDGACDANQRRQECLWVSPLARQPTLFDGLT